MNMSVVSLFIIATLSAYMIAMNYYAVKMHDSCDAVKDSVKAANIKRYWNISSIIVGTITAILTLIKSMDPDGPLVAVVVSTLALASAAMYFHTAKKCDVKKPEKDFSMASLIIFSILLPAILGLIFFGILE